jgi:hypothetical protein
MSTILTIDDFDPLFVYSDYTAWETPNPQDHPTWWNASEAETGSIWHQGGCLSYDQTRGQPAKLSDVPLHHSGGHDRLAQLHR